MTQEQLNRAIAIKDEIASLTKHIKTIEAKDIAIGYLFNENEIKQRKQEKILELLKQIDKLNKEFQEL